MASKIFKVGDVVMLVSGGTTLYKIVLLYDQGNSICNYVDQDTYKIVEISIPVVALAKFKDERHPAYAHPAHYNMQYEAHTLPYRHLI